MIDVAAYLQRIGYSGPLDATAETLRAMHTAHLMTVPFENLSIALGQKIVLDEISLFDKIVKRRRGGFCYEANGLFAALLRDLGFDVTLLSAGVARQDASFGPEFDHLTLRVDLEEPWLVDVGFGDSFREPLRFAPGDEQVQDEYRYCIAHLGAYFYLQRSGDGAEWEPQYRFTSQPHRLSDFAHMCHYHQTAPASSFTQQHICTLATPDGRVTLSDMRLITTKHGERIEQILDDPLGYDAALREHFGIVLPDPP